MLSFYYTNFKLQKGWFYWIDSVSYTHLPNDIVINGKKIVGILTEMSTEVDYINHVVIGVGINVNIGDFPSEIQKTASSLCTEAGHPVKRAPIIAAILKKFERYYEEFLDSGDLSSLQEAYNHMLVNCGREVRILGEREELSLIHI